MFDRYQHLSDADLVRLIDWEVSGDEAEAMRDHVAHCPECSLRVERAEETLDRLNEIYASPTSDTGPASTLSRLRLQQQMVAARSHRSWWRQHSASIAAAAVVLVVMSVGLNQWQAATRRTLPDRTSSALPNRSLTPGSIRPVTIGEICATKDEDLDPEVPASIQSAVLTEYGIHSSETDQKYQIDYLVNPQLGGTNDIRNLWPQPYRDAVWNAEAKDALEKRLHQMVCNRTVDLNVAQREIETDWIAAYKKYVQQNPG